MDIDVWSDIACPWCYVGKRRLEAALTRFGGDVTVTWHSFELDPNARPVREGQGDNADRLARKYGMSREQALTSMASLTETAATEGLDFRLNESKGGNTFDAHRLSHLALENGIQDQVVERLMRAYQCEALPVGDHATLRALAVEAGLPAGEVDAVLESDRYADQVRADEALAAQLQISAVPCFVVDRRLAAMGAQDPDTLVGLLEQAAGQAAASGAESTI